MILGAVLFLGLSCCALLGWCVILPPLKERDGFETYDFNLRTEGRPDSGHITER